MYIEPRPLAAAIERPGWGSPAAAKRAGSQSLRLSWPAAAAAAAAAIWLLLLLDVVIGDERPIAEAAEDTTELQRLAALKEDRPLRAGLRLLPSLGLRTGLALTLPDPKVPADSLSEARPMLPWLPPESAPGKQDVIVVFVAEMPFASMVM